MSVAPCPLLTGQTAILLSDGLPLQAAYQTTLQNGDFDSQQRFP
jgi:hypothetical protein